MWFWKQCYWVNCKNIDIKKQKCNPELISLPNTPAPSSKILEDFYYPKLKNVVNLVKKMMN